MGKGILVGTYSYSVSRYVHDPVRDEAVNIGVIAVDPGTGGTGHRFMDDVQRLRLRCPGANLEALDGIVKSIKVRSMPGGAEDLSAVSNRFTNSLQFTRPRAVTAPSLRDAVEKMYARYVSEPAAGAGGRRAPRRALLEEISLHVQRSKFPDHAVRMRPRFDGTRGVLVPDYGFFGEDLTVALKAFSFARPHMALRDAKAFAIDVEDAMSRHDRLECTVVVDSAAAGGEAGAEQRSGGGGGGRNRARTLYNQASGHLSDKGCSVVSAAAAAEQIASIRRRVA